jgi:hypothetical protein
MVTSGRVRGRASGSRGIGIGIGKIAFHGRHPRFLVPFFETFPRLTSGCRKMRQLTPASQEPSLTSDCLLCFRICYGIAMDCSQRKQRPGRA